MDVRVKVRGDVLEVSTLRRRGKGKLLQTGELSVSRKALKQDPAAAVDFLVSQGATKPRNVI